MIDTSVIPVNGQHQYPKKKSSRTNSFIMKSHLSPMELIQTNFRFFITFVFGLNFFDHFFPDSHLVNYETKNEITNKKSDIGKKWNNQYKFEVIGLDAQSTSHIHLSIHLEFTVGTCAATASDFHDAVSKKSEKKLTKAKNENIQQKKSAKKRN